MEDKWRINKIGDDFYFIPKKERDEKLQYERLLSNISKREKKIESELIKIGKLKEDLREMKKNRTKGFNKMIKYHKKFLPSFSYSKKKVGFTLHWGWGVPLVGRANYKSMELQLEYSQT